METLPEGDELAWLTSQGPEPGAPPPIEHAADESSPSPEGLSSALQLTIEQLLLANQSLQATNTRLRTALADLHQRFERIVDAEADLLGLMQAGRSMALIVDEGLCVQRYTPEAASLFRLQECDIGSPLPAKAIAPLFDGLMQDLESAIARGAIRTREIQTPDSRVLLATVYPVRGAAAARRAVLSFLEITASRQAEQLVSVFDALPSNVAVLDELGVVQQVNREWRNFALANGAEAGALGPGTNYLDAIDRAAELDPAVGKTARGLRAVLCGEKPGFVDLYPCHAPRERRWFLMHVMPLGSPCKGAVVSHLNVTGWLSSRGSPLSASSSEAGAADV